MIAITDDDGIFLAHLPERGGVICFSEYAPLFAGYDVHVLGPVADKADIIVAAKA